MFEKVLVANRGEIAIRLLRTLRDLRIPSVAVFSDADRESAHWRFADEAYELGDPTPAASYLCQQKLLDIAKRSGAKAVLPGYGFLSENAEFARACAREGIVFVGPTPDVIDAMGQKENARKRMEGAGVPVVPGGPASTLAEALASAERVSYPVLVKAAAGGGGRGMRVAHDPGELSLAFDLAQSEASRAFGSDQVYVEKLITGARHVEVQVLGDQYGNVVHLHERDCSIQRRHQKLVEETPCPILDVETRAALTGAAVAGARAVGYTSAGTFEFLLGPSGDFYFIEMNTRLQVEHTVTELVTGIDLVRAMLEVSSGQPLGVTQADIVPRGHAIQCRVCAEDPRDDFRPSAGRIEHQSEPAGPFVRIDSGIQLGQRVSSFYDSLLSKVCAFADTRDQALLRLRRALDEYVITGVETNLEFHRRLLASDDFCAGRYDTSFIATHPDLMQPRPLRGAALAAWVVEQHLHGAGRRTLREVPVSRWAASGRPSRI